MDAKDLLLQYENYERQERNLRDFLSSQKDGLDSVDVSSIWFPKQYKEELKRQRKKLTDYEKRLVGISDTKQKILDLISDIPDIEGEVLTRRYVYGENWEEICEGIHYSWTGVFKVHDRALRMVQERLDQGLFSL